MLDDDNDTRVLIVPTVTIPPMPVHRDPLCNSCGRRITPAGMCGCNDR